MSERSPSVPRPVGLPTILGLFLCFGLYLLAVDRLYVRHRAEQPFNVAPDKFSKDLAWKGTPESRSAYLGELRAKQAKQLETYGWVDRKKGTVQLPIDRAMELVVQQYGSKPSPQ